MKTILKVTAIALAVAASATTFAGTTTQQNQSFSPFYAGVALNYTHNDWKTIVKPSSDSPEPSYSKWTNPTGGFGATLYAGYRLSNWASVEAGWGIVPMTKVTITPAAEPVGRTAGAPTAVSISDNMFYTALVLAHQIGDYNMAVFTKVGPGLQSISISKNDVLKSTTAYGLFGSIGVTYALTPTVGLSVAASGLSGATNHAKSEYAPNLYQYSVQLSYLF